MSTDGERQRPELTIVGGQPSGERRGRHDPEVEVPVGFEMLLYLAARDQRFRDRLLADRAAALAESGVPLRPSEEATLRAIANEALARMIERLVPDNPWGRQRMGKVAAAVTALAAGTVVGSVTMSCDPPTFLTAGVTTNRDVEDTHHDTGGATATSTGTATRTVEPPRAVPAGALKDTSIDGAPVGVPAEPPRGK